MVPKLLGTLARNITVKFLRITGLDPTFWEAEALCEFEDSHIYITSSGIVRATKRDSV